MPNRRTNETRDSDLARMSIVCYERFMFMLTWGCSEYLSDVHTSFSNVFASKPEARDKARTGACWNLSPIYHFPFVISAGLRRGNKRTIVHMSLPRLISDSPAEFTNQKIDKPETSRRCLHAL